MKGRTDAGIRATRISAGDITSVPKTTSATPTATSGKPIMAKKPVTVSVGAILLVLFGLISLYRIPIQLTPNVDLPEISIETVWVGASPNEVEREIIDVQEEELKNLEGLEEMTSESRDSYAYINLMFEIGTDPVHFVYKANARHSVAIGLAPYGFRLRLNSRHPIEYYNATVQDTQTALHFCSKVDVARGVNDIDLVISPGTGGSR